MSRAQTLCSRDAALVLAVAVLACTGATEAAAEPGESGMLDFSRDVRPILSENCFHCHGPDAEKREADLRLDTREGIAADLGGYAAVVAGEPSQSELVARIRNQDRDELMPPPKSKRVLSPSEIEILERWVAQGAKWAEHWAFVPPQRPPLPKIKGRPLKSANPIDAFIRARLESEGLAPSPPADRRTILRRVTLELTGLPPTLEEIEAFLADRRPGAYERVVDRLLASERYGERMAWNWLDAARYADTNGYQGDPERTMWPWRDWVVRALNENMPFARFTIEQLAGDLLPEPTRDQLVATAFNRNNMHNGEGGRIAEETRVENLFDRVETTGTLWMGLTMTCTRCHDHKYDPLTMRDYYALYDFFNQSSEKGKGRGGQIAPTLDLATATEKDRAEKARESAAMVASKVDEAELTIFPRPAGKSSQDSPRAKDLSANIFLGLAQSAGKRSPEKIRQMVADFRKSEPDFATLLQQLKDALDARGRASAAVTRIMIMDTIAKPRDTFILVKGSYRDLTETRVSAAFPKAFAPAAATDGPLDRLDLARWLVSPENPLTARVTVNRYWQLFFGRGLVRTTENFGVQSSPPSHPELLDWLAVEFIE
ncbi:MAG: PSD1 and planctomycete cytochrome C domain-containing protein, partial [Verrucomicrobiales bacterium]